MGLRILTLVAASVLLTGCSNALVAKSPIAGQEAPIGKLPESARPLSYQVEIKIDPRQKVFTGQVDMSVQIDEPADGIWIHGDDIRVQTITVEGEAASYEEVLPTGVSRVSFANTYPAGNVNVEITYEADFDVNLAGLFRVEEEGEAYALAKSESIQARRFLPGFDEPGYKAPFDISLIIPKGDEAISNTPIIFRSPYSDDETFEKVTFATTRPLSTYLLSVAVGPFDVVEYPPLPANSVRTVEIPLRGFARKGRGGDLKRSLDITADMVRVFEEAVQLPYPYKKLDIIAAPQWPSGATELAGAITYRESRLLLDENSGPAAYRSMLGIHSHEIAHMWFGNLVTPPWWDDLWLKEAYATWGTPLALQALEPDGGHEIDMTARAIGVMGLDSLASTRAVREPIDRNEDIRNAYDGITYSKGMAVISMADAYFGADIFRPALGEYLKVFEDTEADSPDFYRVIGEVTKEPAMTEVFRSFIEQKGLPLINVKLNALENSNTVTLSQSRYRPLGSTIKAGTQWAIPVCLAYGKTDGSRDRTCSIMQDKSVTVALDDLPTFILPNAGGGGYFRWSLDQAGWATLIDHFDLLTPSEALSTIDSAAAAFAAGDGDAATLLAVLEKASTHADRRVAVAPMTILRRYASMLAGDDRKALGTFAADLYRPALAKLGTPSDDDGVVLKNQIERFLALTAKDRDLRAKLLQSASSFIGLNGTPNAKALGSDSYSQAMQVGVEDGGDAFFDRLREAYFDIDDPVFAGVVPRALGSVTDPERAQQVRQLAFDGTLGPRETYGLISRQMSNPDTRLDTWAWLEKNYATFVTKIPAQWPRRTPGLAGSFCEADRIKSLDALFSRVGDLAPGHERALAQTKERITLCAALKENKAAELAAALDER